MSFIPKPHEIYKHFKGNLYQITAIAEHTETGETLVVYQALYGDFKTYARPLDMFISPVDRGKYPDAAQEFRFELQGPDAARQKAEMGVYIRRDSENSGVEPMAGGMSPLTGKAAEPTGGQQVQCEPTGGQQVQCEPTGGQQVQCGQTGRKQAQSGKETFSGSSWQEGAGSAEQEEESEEFNIDPMVLEFLDADSYEQRLNILTGLRHRITDDMITTMAIACDVEIAEGDIEERYESLKTCLLTMERYECNRLR